MRSGREKMLAMLATVATHVPMVLKKDVDVDVSASAVSASVLRGASSGHCPGICRADDG
jgi:hypothetical protein